jgi:hypothetical protein
MTKQNYGQMVSMRLENNLFKELKKRLKVEKKTLSDLGRELFTTYLQYRNKVGNHNSV